MTPTEALKKIATLADLPSDTEPGAVAEKVRLLKEQAETTYGLNRMVAYHLGRADQFKAGLEDAAQALEKGRDDLRAKSGAELIAARATITRIAGDLNGAAALAETALEEPPEPKEDD